MKPRTLRAGPLSMVLQDGDISGIRLGNREVLQRVYEDNLRTARLVFAAYQSAGAGEVVRV